MINLFRAEWKKATRNAALYAFLVGVFPIGVMVFFLLMGAIGVLSPSFAEEMATQPDNQWTIHAVSVWLMVTSFPTSTIGGILPLAFMVVVFASEYHWGTWKNLVPRNRRFALILIKFFTLSLVVMTSLALTSLLLVIGNGIMHGIAGVPYEPALGGKVLGDFACLYLREMLLAFISLLILAGFAAWSALLTRSILGGLLAGFFFSIIEPMSYFLLFMLGHSLNRPSLVNLYRFFPSYNLANLRSWLATGVAHNPNTDLFIAAPSLASTLFLLALWVFGLMGLAVCVFERQDITA
jgi:hypothetical protein